MDIHSNAVINFQRVFTIVNPVNGTLENSLNNDDPNLATVISLLETPSGSGFLTGLGGSLSSEDEVDYLRFSANSGDKVTVWLDTLSQNGNGTISLEIQNPFNQTISNSTLNSGEAVIQNVIINQNGFFYVKVQSSGSSGKYYLRIDSGRNNLQLESEPNNSSLTANQPWFFLSENNFNTRIGGSLTRRDVDGDYYMIGGLNTCDSIMINVLFPVTSSLKSNEVALLVLKNINETVETNYSDELYHVVTEKNTYYFKVASTNLGYRNQYYLNITVNDATPPYVKTASLPQDGGTAENLIYSFSIEFSEKIETNQLLNISNYSLINTNNEQFALGILNTNDMSRITFYVINGPLPTSEYIFTVSSNIVDLAGNKMMYSFIRGFKVPEMFKYINEIEDNNTTMTATPVGIITNIGGGSFYYGNVLTVGTQPQYILAAYVDTDTNLDLITVNSLSNDITIMYGNGDGTFTGTTNYVVGLSPYSVGCGDLNNDCFLDIVTANYSSHNISVLMNTSNGTFSNAIDYAAGQFPCWIVLADINNDGKLDAILANYDPGKINVLKGVGDGSFTNKTEYDGVDGAWFTAIGDFNNDNRADIVAGGYIHN